MQVLKHGQISIYKRISWSRGWTQGCDRTPVFKFLKTLSVHRLRQYRYWSNFRTPTHFELRFSIFSPNLQPETVYRQQPTYHGLALLNQSIVLEEARLTTRTIQYRMSTWAGSRESNEYRYGNDWFLLYNAALSPLFDLVFRCPLSPYISHVHTVQEHLLQIYERHIKISKDRPHMYAIPKSRRISTNLGVPSTAQSISRNFLVYFWAQMKLLPFTEVRMK